MNSGQFQKGVVPWNKGKKGVMPPPHNKGVPMSEEMKARVSATKKGMPGVNRGKKFSEEWRHNLSKAHIGILAQEKHHQWKGDEVGYYTLHKWVNKQLGHPMRCEHCGFESDNRRQFHWANKTGLYLRDVGDWIRLCASCHRRYDNANGVAIHPRFK